MRRLFQYLFSVFYILTACVWGETNPTPDPLPSWNAGPTKTAILRFVQNATDHNSKDYIPPDERIAAFDQDGTLWVEQPAYTQWYFTVDRLKALAPTQPSWWNQRIATLAKSSPDDFSKLSREDIEVVISKTHSGMSVEAFHQFVQEWLNKALHPRFKRPYTQLIYQPMLEVMQFLRNNGFKTYIVSGGGQEFVRSYASTVYGVPPEHIIGTADKVKYDYNHGQPILMKLPQLLYFDDKEGKPEGINLIIGRRPVITFGNSDGDRQMLEWTQGGKGASLELLVHHDDAQREYAYGPNSKIGTFSDALMTEAKKNDWIVISMKDDWNVIFPWQKKDANTQR